MTHKVQIEVTGPVQDPTTGEVLYQPGARFDEGAKELDGLPVHMLRPVIVDDEAEKAAEKAEKADKADEKPAAATSKPAVSGKSA